MDMMTWDVILDEAVYIWHRAKLQEKDMQPKILVGQWPAGFESRLVPDLPLPFISTLIGLWAFDLESSPVWWEATTNNHRRNLLPSFLGTYRWSTSSLWCKVLCIVMSFLVRWSIYWSSQVHCKNSHEYLTSGSAQVCIPLMRFLICSLVSSSFLVLLRYSFYFFFFHLRMFHIFPSTCRFPFLCAFWFCLDLVVLFLVRPDRENETQFFPSSGRVDTAIWMHYMDAN